MEGDTEGTAVGDIDGCVEIVGLDDGLIDGTSVGDKLGKSEGDDEGLSVGLYCIDCIEKRER